MDFGWSLMQMYPNSNPSQYEIIANPDGSFTITQWNVPNTPKPNESDVVAYWNTNGINLLRQQKINELRASFNQAVNGTFTSNAMGVAHTYLAVQAQENYNSEVHRYLIDPTYSSTLVDTVDAGLISHSKDQFFQVFKDGHDFVVQQRQQLEKLISDVNTATTPTAINLIKWA